MLCDGMEGLHNSYIAGSTISLELRLERKNKVNKVNSTFEESFSLYSPTPFKVCSRMNVSFHGVLEGCGRATQNPYIPADHINK